MADGYKRPRIYNFFVMMFYNEMLRANLSTFYGRALLIQVDLLIRFQCQTRAEEDYEFLSDADAKNMKNKTKKIMQRKRSSISTEVNFKPFLSHEE